uniref:Uncharacterized protein n=1 Tax=Eucampia antarctica TaxID=49252 RepID=A0A7S2QZU2_9STRA|mmetsp:Transcript_11073/g.10602  ORF Transcript_11073/g.10602 Transcript_11073/m.10602 type:complete len:259 (+) Transcript_11073:94-870(+)
MVFRPCQCLIALYYLAGVAFFRVAAFSPINLINNSNSNRHAIVSPDKKVVSPHGVTATFMAGQNTLEKLPEDDDTPVPFVDVDKNEFIECYADSIAVVNGIEYTVGTPCDYPVALCFFDNEDQLIPIELDEELMDDIFPLAESIVEEEFGEELNLQRTSQTLTLMGELDDEEEDEYDDDEEEDGDNEEEEVEIMISFEHKGREYSLVRLLDPVLLVAKNDPENSTKRILLTEEESNKVMPILEDLFLDYQEEKEGMEL